MLIQGKAKWAKVIGEPGWGYENKFKEWSIDVYIDEYVVHKLEAEGLGDKIKDKGNGQYITFKRKELKTSGPKQGEANDPIRVVDSSGNVIQQGKPDAKDYVAAPKSYKIGNGSTVNVNFALNEYKPGQVNANILSLQVWDLVPYEGGEFPVKEETTTPSASATEDWSSEVEEAAPVETAKKAAK